MNDSDSIGSSAKAAAVGALILVNLCLLVWLGSAAQSHAGKTSQSTAPSWSWADGNGPNVVTNFFVASADTLDQMTTSANQAIVSTADSIGDAATGTGRFIGSIGSTVATAFGSGLGGIAHLIGSGARSLASLWLDCLMAQLKFLGNCWSSTLNLPVTTVGIVAKVPSALITPANAMQQPIIDAPTLPASLAAAELVSAKPKPKPVKPQWPIHGVITTLFGVPEPPYQPIHTGIDISDAAPAGVTPVYPVLPGKVIKVIHSSSGLGNHIIIDHGHGLTSVYGHLHDTSVIIGEQVSQHTVLGHEGSTGVSTGPHVHLEIRQDGVARNPMNYIDGRP